MKTIRLRDLKERINQLSIKYQLTVDTDQKAVIIKQEL